MKKLSIILFHLVFSLISSNIFGQSDSIVLRDVMWDVSAPARSTELFIPSGNSLLAGLLYSANGLQKHPTLLLLHGYPGNERNLDMAQIVRSKGWNVIYFDYRGSWGSQGTFSFDNCVQDVISVVSFCNKYQDSLRIDTSNIVLFGHSMGGWVCLKALQKLPAIKKGFALSSWNIGEDFKNVATESEMVRLAKNHGEYFVLNTSIKELFKPVIQNNNHYNLINDGKALANKQIIMLDEHNRNQQLAETIKAENRSFFDYEIWQTDHSFTNKRLSLINKVLEFLNR
ncbi:MAG: alpha/beta hydrolase family protein [Flavisolibacter sp.]